MTHRENQLFQKYLSQQLGRLAIGGDFAAAAYDDDDDDDDDGGGGGGGGDDGDDDDDDGGGDDDDGGGDDDDDDGVVVMMMMMMVVMMMMMMVVVVVMMMMVVMMVVMMMTMITAGVVQALRSFRVDRNMSINNKIPQNLRCILSDESRHRFYSDFSSRTRRSTTSRSKTRDLTATTRSGASS